MGQDKVVAVMGSPGSGKTTASIKMALELASHKKNVIVVFCDPFTPVIPFVVPWTGEQASIGALLTAPSLTQKMILDSCITIKDQEYISLIGYHLGDSLMAYPQITRERAVDFFVCLRHLSDYIIIDCAAVYEADVLSLVAMELSDRMIRIGTSNLRGISYFESRKIMLSDRRFGPEKQLHIIGNLKAGQEWEAVSEQYGGVAGILPYNAELDQQYDELSLFEMLRDKEAALYSNEIRKLINLLFGMGKDNEETKMGVKDRNKTTASDQSKPGKERTRKKFTFHLNKNRGEF